MNPGHETNPTVSGVVTRLWEAMREADLLEFTYRTHTPIHRGDPFSPLIRRLVGLRHLARVEERGDFHRVPPIYIDDSGRGIELAYRAAEGWSARRLDPQVASAEAAPEDEDADDREPLERAQAAIDRLRRLSF
jgi:hypothetical protein